MKKQLTFFILLLSFSSLSLSQPPTAPVSSSNNRIMTYGTIATTTATGYAGFKVAHRALKRRCFRPYTDSEAGWNPFRCMYNWLFPYMPQQHKATALVHAASKKRALEKSLEGADSDRNSFDEVHQILPHVTLDQPTLERVFGRIHPPLVKDFFAECFHPNVSNEEITNILCAALKTPRYLVTKSLMTFHCSKLSQPVKVPEDPDCTDKSIYTAIETGNSAMLEALIYAYRDNREYYDVPYPQAPSHSLLKAVETGNYAMVKAAIDLDLLRNGISEEDIRKIIHNIQLFQKPDLLQVLFETDFYEQFINELLPKNTNFKQSLISTIETLKTPKPSSTELTQAYTTFFQTKCDLLDFSDRAQSQYANKILAKQAILGLLEPYAPHEDR